MLFSTVQYLNFKKPNSIIYRTQTSVICFDEVKKSINGKENNELKVVMKKRSSEIEGNYSQYEKRTMLLKKNQSRKLTFKF